MIRRIVIFKFLIAFLIFSCCYQTQANNHDYLCNNGTHFACICFKGDDENLKSFYPDCKKFIASASLPVVKLSVRVSSQENIMKYEEFFKQRLVSSLLTIYCMNGTHECLGTTLPIRESNVVVLNLTSDGRDQSTIYYTVAKPRDPLELTSDNVLGPNKIIHILNLTMAKPSSWLRHATIIEHTSAEITVDGSIKVVKESSDNFHENIVFFIFLIVLGLLVGLIYIVAIAKVIRDHKRQSDTRKNERNKKNEANATATVAPNYGAITDFETVRINKVEPENQTVLSNSSGGQQQIYIAPLRVGDVDAYEAAEPEHQSSNSIYDFLNNIRTKKLIKSTSNNSMTSKSISHVKKSKSAHHKMSSAAEEPVILRKPNFDDLKKFYTVFQCKDTENDKNVIIKNLNAPRITIDDIQATNDSFRDETQETTLTAASRDKSNYVHDSNDFANFDYFMANSEQIPSDAAAHVDWPTTSGFAVSEGNLKSIAASNPQSSLSAADILTTSYTEENLIKSEVSSIADSNSDSESEVSEHSLLQPLADYQPLRESSWSISRLPDD